MSGRGSSSAPVTSRLSASILIFAWRLNEDSSVAIIACPSCHKAINVPQKKVGRWIACPVCNMEFAALPDEADQEEEEPESTPEPEEPPPARSIFASRFVIPVGLLLLVAIVGVLAYAMAKHSSKNGPNQPGVTVSPNKMPPVDKRTDDDPFGLQSLQGGGGLDSVLGIGSSIKSFFYWTTVLSVVFLITSVVMLIWMARDSRNRGMEGVATWIMPILFTNILAFSVYYFSRPKGTLVQCRHCNNRCLENALTCPHCRRNKPVRKKRPKFDD